MSETPWEPSQPLRHDATDTTVLERSRYAADNIAPFPYAAILVARELAEAVAAQRVAERDAEEAVFLTGLRAKVQECEAQLAAVTAERDRLRKAMKRALDEWEWTDSRGILLDALAAEEGRSDG